MNVLVDFDELSILVLNGLGSTYSNLSHTLQVQDTLVTFEHLLNYEAQLQHSIPLASPAFILTTAVVTLLGSSSHRWLNNCGATTTTGLHSPRHHLMPPKNFPDFLYQPRSGRVSISGMLLLCLHGTQLHLHSSGRVATSGVVSFMV